MKWLNRTGGIMRRVGTLYYLELWFVYFFHLLFHFWILALSKQFHWDKQLMQHLGQRITQLRVWLLFVCTSLVGVCQALSRNECHFYLQLWSFNSDALPPSPQVPSIHICIFNSSGTPPNLFSIVYFLTSFFPFGAIPASAFSYNVYHSKKKHF